jgi:chromate reductase, NAD(P)H dehydrogenase (quinone)
VRGGSLVRLLAFAGSSREGSWNRKLIRIASAGAEEAGAKVTLIELADYPMPLMNEDLEAREGMPEKARAFKQLLLQHDGILIASPEYNGSIPPLLKNSLDWASRKEEVNEATYLAFQGKVAAIVSASPGNLGGLRGLLVLRMLLGNLGVLVLPDQRAVSGADKAFSEDGSLSDPAIDRAVRRIGRKLAETAASLNTH